MTTTTATPVSARFVEMLQLAIDLECPAIMASNGDPWRIQEILANDPHQIAIRAKLDQIPVNPDLILSRVGVQLIKRA